MSERATIELVDLGNARYEVDASLQIGDLCGQLPPQPWWTVGDLEAAALSLSWVLEADETKHGRRHLYFRRRLASPMNAESS